MQLALHNENSATLNVIALLNSSIQHVKSTESSIYRVIDAYAVKVF